MKSWDGPKTDHIDKSNETQLAVLVNGHLSEWFQMTVGNRQGDPLSLIVDHLLVPGENNG